MSDERPFLGQDCVTPYRRIVVLRRWLWAFVQATAFRWSPRPFHTFRAYLLRWFGATISEPRAVVVFPTVKVTMPWNLTLEPHAMVGPSTLLYSLGPITVHRGANISQGCHLCAGTHDFNRWSMPLVTKAITIGENAWLAADVFVAPGVSIGELTVVGARSVVVRDLPARHVCVGHPCRPIKPRVEPIA